MSPHEPAYKGAMRCKAQCQKKLEASRGPAYPPMGEATRHTRRVPYQAVHSHAFSCYKGNAPSWTGSKLLSHERHKAQGSHAWLRATPTGPLRKGKPAKAASKRTSALESQGTKSWMAASPYRQASGVWQHSQHCLLSGHTIGIEEGEQESRFPPAKLACISP